MPNLKSSLATKTQDIYNLHGLQFDKERTKNLFEKKWLQRFQRLLPSPAHILDVGCGTGEPIAQYFIEEGILLTGIDFSTTMIDIARQRFPDNDWHVADMRNMQLNKTFNGIISWHSFFHLTSEEQYGALTIFSKHLTQNGVLMLTIGSKAGEEIGHVCGDEVYHASLSQKQYREALEKLDMQIIAFTIDDPECGNATVLLAQKIK